MKHLSGGNLLPLKPFALFSPYGLIFLALIILSSLFHSCRNKDNAVKVVQRSFMDVVELQQNFNITFNRDLIPDSLVDHWEQADYFKFTPPVEGKFKWVSTHEVMFSPGDGLAPCTNYKLELNQKSILKHAGKKLYLDGDVAFSFHTALLNLSGADFHWTAAEANAQQPVLNLLLNFNYALNPAEVIRRLKITTDGKVLTVKLAETSINATIHIEIADAPVSDNDIPVKIIIDKGISVPKSTYITDKEMSYEAVIPSKSKLVISNVETDHTGEQGSIMVTTSEEVKESTVKTALHFDPEIDFTVMKNERGFTVNSKQFDASNSYKITINTTLEGVLGGKLKEAYSQDVIFGKLQPLVKFVSEGKMYLPAKGNRNIAINITSIPKVKVRIYKIYENNIIQFMKQGTQNESHYDRNYNDEGEEDEGNYSDFYHYNTSDYGDLVWEQDYETRKMEKLNSARVFHLDFEDKIKDQHGIYVLQVQSSEQNWIQANKILAVSDIGLIVKESQKSVMVIANSVQDARALSGVKLNIISRKNQSIKTITTDNDGVAVFDKSENTFPHYDVGMITAQVNDDYNFIQLGYSSEYDDSREDVGGKYTNRMKYDAFLYGDRDIYRPGETMYISCIVRDLQWNKPGDLPVKLKVYLPNGREFKTIRKTLNDQGSFEAAVSLPPGIVTGNYRLTVSTSDDLLLASKSLSIEEFMPDKISIRAKLVKDTIFAGDTLKTNIVATNLFGPPASDRNYTMEVSLSTDYFSSKTFGDYNFNFQNRSSNYAVIERSGKTNDQGMIKEAFVFPASQYNNNGLLSGKVFTTVFDESGRPVNRENHFRLYT